MEPSGGQCGNLGFLKAFKELEGPRTRTCPHWLDELLMVALCAITSGADGWVSVVDWGRLKLEWLRRFLPFANGIASHDTFSRVFSLLDAQRFEACFIDWMQDLCPTLKGQLIPIDGKSVRGSHDGALGVAHLVSAWHSAAGLVQGQVKTATKSNEITAIPEFLDALDVQGATITIDAMGCQHAIVDKIMEKKVDYIVAVKDNQPTLAQAVESLFNATDTSVREGERSTEWRYYISSLQVNASEFNAKIRAHWGIENSCHWVLDMAFGEDDCRIRTGDGAQNFAILRRIALNLIKQEKSSKTSVNIKRLKAGWSTDYLQTLLGLRPL